MGKIKAKRLASLIRYSRQSPDEVSDIIATLLKEDKIFESTYHQLTIDSKTFAGILTIILGKRTMNKIMPYLYENEIQQLQDIIAYLNDLDYKQINYVATETLKLIKHRHYTMRGGKKKSEGIFNDDDL